MAHLVMPESKLNRKTAERIVDLFLSRRKAEIAAAGATSHFPKTIMKQENYPRSLCVVLVLAGLGGRQGARRFARSSPSARPSLPRRKPFPPRSRARRNGRTSIPAVGSISAVQGVRLTAEIPGTVAAITFESGAVVAKGDLLLRLDMSTEEAQLRALEAQVEYSRTSLARYQSLRSGGTVSQAELDQAETDLKQKQANADTIRTAIAKKVIRAPFAGKLGIRQINVGEYLESGKFIVSLHSLAPVYADFSLPQQELARVKTGLAVRVTTDTYPDKQFLRHAHRHQS